MRIAPLLAVVAFASMVVPACYAQDGVDFEKARQLRQRSARGEKLTEEEREYLERARQARRGAARPPGRLTPKEKTGLVPLSDMTAEDRYKGEDGGLYGGGRNEPPQSHQEAAHREVKAIRPLDAQGKPSPDGKIVLISVGMSNTTQEFSRFRQLAAADPERSRQVVIVDGAQGGMDSRAWAEPGQVEPRNPRRRPDPWGVLEMRLDEAGATAAQVQVAWLKQARINPAGVGEFPRHTDELRSHIQVIVQNLKEKYPNLRVVYLSSRIYAGYATGGLNPEPYAYESAFAVRQLIQAQIEGEPALNWEPQRGDVKAPLLLWGPYLWADGTAGRQSDALVYTREDLAGDGTHPSLSGRQKVAELLLRFFKNDLTAKPWFTRS